MTRSPTPKQLEYLAAWWWAKGDYARAAFMVRKHRQTVKNALMAMRATQGARSNVELVQEFMDEVLARRAA